MTFDVTVTDLAATTATETLTVDVQEPPPYTGPTPGLPRIVWDGMDLNFESPDGTSLVVTNLAGWYGLPSVTSNDVDRALVDGQAAGPKVLGARDLTLEGYVIGQTRTTRPTIVKAIDDLVALANRRDMSTFTVSDPWLGIGRQAEIRAVGALEHTWNGPWAWHYTVPLRAYDPRLYESGDGNTVTLTPRQSGTGRVYVNPDPTVNNIRGPYPWEYASKDTGHSAQVVNDGNLPAPLLLTYRGSLGDSRVQLVGAGSDAVLLSAVGDGVTIYVNSETLTAWADGGYGRPAYIKAGSRPLTLPPGFNGRISLYAPSGTGSVTVTWRSAWL